MKRHFIDFLKDMLNYAQSAESFVKGMSFDNFETDNKTIFATVRALEVIGEASKNIPEEVKAKYPEIPWRDMAGMRNKLIHEYFGVNIATVWKTATEEIIELKAQIEKIIQELEE